MNPSKAKIKTARRIDFASIKTIRLECKTCAAAKELPVCNLRSLVTPGSVSDCPGCGASLVLVQPTDPMPGSWGDLTKLLDHLWADNGKVKIEFVLPVQ
jgi:hypothetical protein